MGTGEGGGKVVGKGRSLLVKAFCFSVSELQHVSITPNYSFNIVWHCALS